MTPHRFPKLDAGAVAMTRDALHAYSRVMGAWLKAIRARRKHWWHASLRPSLFGLTTGVVRAGVDFEVELSLVRSQIHVRTSDRTATEDLIGQSARDVGTWLDETLLGIGIDPSLTPRGAAHNDQRFAEYSGAQAHRQQHALASVAASLEEFRAGIREEASPIQVWPHHFDLSMIWLPGHRVPGHRVPGQDPLDEEKSDKQMNFGFVFGDEVIVEPYLYVTVYPFPDGLLSIELPAGATWRSEGFKGAALRYDVLCRMDDPAAYLQELWSKLLHAGRQRLATDE